MPFQLKRASQGNVVLVAASTMAAGLLGMLGIKVVRDELESRRSSETFMGVWHEANDYNPKVVLLYAHESETKSALEERLLDKGYGVLCAGDKSSAVDALAVVDGISAIVALDHDRMPRLGSKDTRINDGFSFPLVRAGKNGANGRFFSALEKAIEQERESAYSLLRKVAGYFETSIGQQGFHKVPPDVESALRQLLEINRFVMRKDSLDAHRGGVIATLKTGTPINRDIYYEDPEGKDLEGICLKPESVSDLGDIERDYEYFRNFDDGVKLARPYFYGLQDESNAIVVRSYFIGPTLAYVFSQLISSDADRGFVQEAVRRTLSASFEKAAEYHAYKRKQAPMTDERVEKVLAHYQESLSATYERLYPLIQSTGLQEKDLLALLDEPLLRRKEWYTEVLDLFLPNFKLRLGKEEPTLEELLEFYSKGGRNSKKDVISEDEIKKNLGIYDQGYVDWHLVDDFARAGFSAYGLPAATGAWVEHAQDFFRKDFLVMRGIRKSGMYSINAHLATLGSELRQEGEIKPQHLAVNFLLISSYKLFRMVDNAISAGLRNEESYANGELSREEYRQHRELYIRNSTAYAENLYFVSLAGADYFEHNKNTPTFADFFKGMKKSCANVLPMAEIPDFRNPTARKLGNYALLGKAISDNSSQMSAMLDEAREKLPYKVMFRD